MKFEDLRFRIRICPPKEMEVQVFKCIVILYGQKKFLLRTQKWGYKYRHLWTFAVTPYWGERYRLLWTFFCDPKNVGTNIGIFLFTSRTVMMQLCKSILEFVKVLSSWIRTFSFGHVNQNKIILIYSCMVTKALIEYQPIHKIEIPIRHPHRPSYLPNRTL